MNRVFTKCPSHLAIAGVVALSLAAAELPTLAQEGQGPAPAAGAAPGRAGGQGLGGAGLVEAAEADGR